MAGALTLDTNKLNVKKSVAVAGSGFDDEVPVTVTIQGPNDYLTTYAVVSALGGDIDAGTFVINAEGMWTIAATDGTNSATETFRASHSG